MKVLVGDAASHRAIAELQALGWGRMRVERRRAPWPGDPWALDNSAFKAWKTGEPWNAGRFLGMVHWALEQETAPLFGVLPDIVGGGLDSLRHSLLWRDRLAAPIPWYLVLEDGMTDADVLPHVKDARGPLPGRHGLVQGAGGALVSVRARARPGLSLRPCRHGYEGRRGVSDRRGQPGLRVPAVPPGPLPALRALDHLPRGAAPAPDDGGGGREGRGREAAGAGLRDGAPGGGQGALAAAGGPTMKRRVIAPGEWEMHRRALGAAINLKYGLNARGLELATNGEVAPHTARSLQEAWETLRETMPDLLTLDGLPVNEQGPT